MKTVTIEVTQEDIEKGERGECEKCALALAVSRVTKYRVEIGLYEAEFYDGPELCVGSSDLPIAAMVFVERFDNGHPVSPFTFPLEVPE
jgi:hypothetical protein